MIRKWLFDIRLSEDKTQEYVANKVKITQQFYSAIEAGERRPSPEKAKEISKALNFHKYGFKWTKFYENGDGIEKS